MFQVYFSIFKFIFICIFCFKFI